MVTKPTSRRRFLAQSGALSAAVASGFWSELPAAETKSPLEKLHLGVIGTYHRGETNLAAIADESIVALCDVDENYLEEASGHFPKAEKFFDFRKMLERDDLDAVIISTPDHTHAHAAVTAMRQGLHVYCERPLAHNIHETRLMVRVAKEKNVVTQMGIQHHSSNGYRRAVELMQSGSIGQVREVHVWTDRPLWPQGVKLPQEKQEVPPHLHWDLWLGPAAYRPYHEAYLPIKWHTWWDFGCGALGDIGLHLIDPVFEGLRLTLPTTIEAKSSPVTRHSAPTWSIVHYQFPARGKLPPVELTWYDGGKIPPRNITGTDRPPTNGVMLLGSRAKLFVPVRGGQPLVIPHDKNDRIQQPQPSRPVSPGHHRQWLDACKGKGMCGSDFQYGAQLTETCLLGNVALRVGKRITWDAKKMAAVDCPQAEPLLRRQYRRGWELS